MDEYQHSLFFEATELTDREKDKIRRHFQQRRDSGGGNCATVENIGGNIYKVSFKEKQVQERVLQRKFHKVALPGGELCLTVSRTHSPKTQEPSTSPSQTCTHPNTKHFEKVFRMNIFLLLYLQDNPKAFKPIQKQLSSISCTLELIFDEGEVVVRGDREKWVARGFGSAVERWELQVDRIFISHTENYLCHHVLDPIQVKQIQQDHSFVTDDIRVYSDSNYVVVVGETEAVKEKIAILERCLPTCKVLSVLDNHFKLVEDEFSQEMSAQYPQVKVTRGTNIITLEGPDDQVQSGAAKLDELIKEIKEKRVQLHLNLLSFMSTSDIVSKYEARFQQSLRSPVTLKIGSDLVLSSLSLSALDEAEAAVLRDLSVVVVQLQGAAAAPPDLNRLKEILNRAKIQVNCSEPRVEVHFISAATGTPATKVQLVGYTRQVNRLKDLLHDFQINQVSTQEVLNLEFPELVDRFDKILQMIGMKQRDVTLKASHVPNPCVMLSGPRCRVHEALQALRSTLTSLIQDTLVFDGPGALRYFQGDGKVNKELVESSCQVLIWEEEYLYSPPRRISSVTPRSYVDTGKSHRDLYEHLSASMHQGGRVTVPPMPQIQQQPSLTADLSFLNIRTIDQQSAFRFLGLCREDVDEAMEKLKDLYKTQCSSHTFKKEELEGLTKNVMLDLQLLMETEGFYMQKDITGNLTVNGIIGGVNKVIVLINTFVHGNLIEKVRLKEEDELYTRVMWCILGQNGHWERLPKTANYNLENRDIAGGIQDVQGVVWQVDLQNIQATARVTGQRTKLKRLENLPDFVFPLYWDSMTADEPMKTVVLNPSSQEYQTVQRGFNSTTTNIIIKIERVQNVHLRRSYEAHKKHISEKNKWTAGAGEKSLYHGTAGDSCMSVMNTGFNRSFAGINGTSFGNGTYFAVEAGCSACYAIPAVDGSKQMFVAQVLVGIYTLGQRGMNVPPVRVSQRPHDRFDSVVDSLHDPSMYVIFHDDQAYPDYLITFM